MTPQTIFAEARRLDLLTGFRGTFTALAALVAAAQEREHEDDEFAAIRAAEDGYERFLEDRGWADKFEEEDRMRQGLYV